jgi:predicted transcriptional regulator of viral defense system
MKGLSKKEVEIISNLEFNQKYFFTASDIDSFCKNKMQRYNTIKSLLNKKRIVKLNRAKYYLIPIKAKSGSWSEHPFIIADESMDGKDYFIGGWAAANYWCLTEQIAMQFDVYTTRRQGRITVLNTRIKFHRTTKKRLKDAVSKTIEQHNFMILKKEKSKKWLKLRN